MSEIATMITCFIPLHFPQGSIYFIFSLSCLTLLNTSCLPVPCEIIKKYPTNGMNTIFVLHFCSCPSNKDRFNLSSLLTTQQTLKCIISSHEFLRQTHHTNFCAPANRPSGIFLSNNAQSYIAYNTTCCCGLPYDPAVDSLH